MDSVNYHKTIEKSHILQNAYWVYGIMALSAQGLRGQS